MDPAARQQLANVAPETVLLRQLPRPEPGLAQQEPRVVAQLLVVELVEDDQRHAAELLRNAGNQGACGVRPRRRL